MDQSGKGHDGTVQGDVTAVPDGKRGGAAKFASGSYLDLDGPNFPPKDIPTSAITIAAWVKCENTGGNQFIFNARASDGTWIIYPLLRGEGQFRWSLRAYGGFKIFDIIAGSVTWDEWLHFAGTYDKASGKAILYINGEVVREENVTNPRNIAGDWGRGARVGYKIDNSRPFTGLMDDFCLFKRALPQAEVQGVMEGSVAPSKNVYCVDADAMGKNDGSSWVDAYWYLQDALAAARYGDEIRVANGMYRPDQGSEQTPGDQEATFQLKNGVTIKGGYAGFGEPDPDTWDIEAYNTILNGDLNGDDGPHFANDSENSYSVVTCIECNASAVLDGFTITGGNATANYIAGGMFNYESSPTVKNCTFTGNTAGQGGGMANRHSNPTVTNCTFSSNATIYGGGGMYNTDRSDPIVTDCIFIENSGSLLGGGGMYNGDSSPTVTNCRFSGNYAMFGGGMYNVGASQTTVTNCTFSENWVSAWGGGMQNEAGAKPTVTNCILWGDIPDEIAFSGSAVVTYSDVQGAWAGMGNIARDPKFADPEGRLSSGSPCIDAGNNDAVPSSINTDLDGNPRIINGTVDMGAYEFGGTTPSPPPGPSADPLSEALDTALSFTTGGNADWFAQTTMTRYDGDAAQSGDISHRQDSWMQTTVSGAGTVKFYWKVSSEEDFDFLEFYIDGSLQEKINGLEVDWEQQTYTISTSGSHTLEWRYVKDGSGDSGSDCGWVDKVEWVTIP